LTQQPDESTNSGLPLRVLVIIGEGSVMRHVALMHDVFACEDPPDTDDPFAVSTAVVVLQGTRAFLHPWRRAFGLSLVFAAHARRTGGRACLGTSGRGCLLSGCDHTRTLFPTAAEFPFPAERSTATMRMRCSFAFTFLLTDLSSSEHRLTTAVLRSFASERFFRRSALRSKDRNSVIVCR
jgi:hypothetical protein